jgi:hypothetical protein
VPKLKFFFNFLQRKQLYGIALWDRFGPDNQMMTINEYISYKKYAIERLLGLVLCGSVWILNRMIPLTVIPLSGGHCTTLFTVMKTIDWFKPLIEEVLFIFSFTFNREWFPSNGNYLFNLQTNKIHDIIFSTDISLLTIETLIESYFFFKTNFFLWFLTDFDFLTI